MGPPTVLLLASACTLCLQGGAHSAGVDHGLTCVSDYFGISCSLSVPPTHDSPDSTALWLLFNQSLPESMEPEKHTCMLSAVDGRYVCSFTKVSPDDDDDEDGGLREENFLDTDVFDIFLCHRGDEGPESCKLLYEGYMPSKHIVPLQPCHLTVNQSSTSGPHLFSWESCYEDYLPDYILINALMYQLRFYKTGHEENGTTVHSTQKSVSLDDDNFELDSKYAARVRSSPDQVTYEGQWSEWSSEVLWKTAPPKTRASLLPDKRWTIPMCVVLPLLLLLCFRPVVQLSKNVLIPTPAPYFQSLYSDCQGDFKTWVVTPNNVDFLMTEETLRIDTLAKSTDEQEEDGSSHSIPCLIGGDPLGGSSHPAPCAALQGFPSAVTPASLLTKTPSSCSNSETVVEGDSGCWLYGDASLDGHWYSNEYCILSDTPNVLQRSGLVKAEACCSGSALDEEMSNRDYHNENQQASVVSAIPPYTWDQESLPNV